MSFGLRLRKFHRWHALIMSIVVVSSATSGMLHTLMARTQAPPPPARPAASVNLAAVTIPPSAISAHLPGEARPVTSLSLHSIDARPWYQVITGPGQSPIYVDAETGKLDETADERYAGQVARRFLGGAPVTKTDYLTAFDDEYIAIFRILPVYRFESDDGRGTRVYVSTMTGSVTRHTDNLRQFEANTFTFFHKWGFIHDRDIRDWLLIAVMSSIIAVAFTGIVLFVMTRPK